MQEIQRGPAGRRGKDGRAGVRQGGAQCPGFFSSTLSLDLSNTPGQEDMICAMKFMIFILDIAEKEKQERRVQRMSERTIDAQRASATIPRDTVQLYEQLRASGLEYGPAFRLLRNVHVPAVKA
eukprot:1142193-Pelagomonas_calceolata.AAC.3